MYEHASIRYTLDAFTTTDEWPPLRCIQAEEYYGPGYFRHGDDFEIPDDLATSFDHFFALPKERQDRFLQAAYWLNQAHRVDSFSAMLLHTVQAIESLGWQRRSQTACPTCNRPEGPGPTRLFNQFLDQYAPGEIEGRRALYNVRSGLSYGSMPPFLTDTEILSGFAPVSHYQRDLVGDALEAAHLAMHSWLRDSEAGTT